MKQHFLDFLQIAKKYVRFLNESVKDVQFCIVNFITECQWKMTAYNTYREETLSIPIKGISKNYLFKWPNISL